ncbi:MAG: Tad domain-containing protein [Anaerolineaceae bacterium]
MRKIYPFERAQALVVIAGAFLALLGMVALAIDGSMVYSDRRDLQSAADNASMSAAAVAAITMDTYAMTYQSFECYAPGVIDAELQALNAAISRAGTYGYMIDTDISDNNGVQITCRMVSNAGLVERYLDVAVKITHQSHTGFTRFVIPNGVPNTVEAISRVQPRRSLTLGNAIASLGFDCGGVDMNGNGTVVIDGGGIFSNSCIDFAGNTDITINVSIGGIGYLTTYTEVGNVDINVIPEQASEGLAIVDIRTPECITQPDYGALEVEGTMIIDGGRYDYINLNGDDHLILNPGLYCLYGNFQTNGDQILEVNPDAPLNQGVTIYMAAGDLLLNGNSEVRLRAPAIDQPPAIKGLLIYMPPSNPGTITLTGTLESWFRGTVYAPTGDINVGGTSDIQYATELVGGSVHVNGTATIIITDDASVNYTRPPLVELYK